MYFYPRPFDEVPIPTIKGTAYVRNIWPHPPSTEGEAAALAGGRDRTRYASVLIAQYS